MATRYYRSTLNARMQKGYDILVDGIRHFKKDILLPSNISDKDISDLHWAIDNDYPEFFYIKDFYTYSGLSKATIVYDISQQQAATILREYEKVADKLIKRCIGKSDLETAIFLHDYLAEHISYDKNEGEHSHKLSYQKNHNILGFSAHETVCEGFSKLYLYLLDRANIPALVVAGNTTAPGRKIDHAWNMVGLKNGSAVHYYYVDVTWDSNGCGKPAKWDYFLLSEYDMFKKNHFPSKKYPLPKAEHSMPLNRSAKRVIMVG